LGVSKYFGLSFLNSVYQEESEANETVREKPTNAKSNFGHHICLSVKSTRITNVSNGRKRCDAKGKTMKTNHVSSKRVVALGTLGVMAASTVGGLALTSSEAHAGSKGRRNTTIALGAATAYGLLKKKKTLAIGAGVGTAVAYSRYRKAKKAEQRRRWR
jgi:hypothetical protein